MSNHPLKSGTANLLIIEPQSSRRILLSNALRGMKFTQLTSVPTVKDALAILESGSPPVNWIMTGLAAGAQHNAMQLLGICLANKNLRHIRVSFFLESDENYCISDAFALGLFSCHFKHSNITGMSGEITKLLTTGDLFEWNDHEIAAHFLREHLKQARMFDSLLRLEKSLLSNFPGNMSYVLNLAEALILSGNAPAAEPILGKINPGQPAEKKRVRELLQFIHYGNPQGGANSSLIAIGDRVKSCVLIDPDATSLHNTEESLKLLGVENVQKFTKGRDAVEFLKRNPEPDLIIQEWRISDYPGPALLQFVRSHGFVNAAIIVYSSLVKNSDRSLLREIGISDVIEKPKSAKILASQISGLVRDEFACQDVVLLEKRIRLMLRIKDLKAARELHKMLLTKRPPEKVRDSIEAEFAYFDDNLKDAIEIAVRVLHSYGEDVPVLNLLGKIYMKQGQFGQAIYYLNRANEMAPSNIERLCNLSVSQACVAEPELAEETLKTARLIAPDEFILDETEVKLGLINGQVERTKTFMEGFRHSSDLIAFVNNRGVLLSTQGRLTEGIQLYETALKSLTENLRDIEPAICYNLALAHVKSGNTKSALLFIQKNPAAGTTDLAAKIRSLSVRLAKAAETGTSVKLNQTSISAPKTPKIARLGDLAWLVQDIEAGAARLYAIFISGEPVSPNVLKMFENMPRFGSRSGLSQNNTITRKSS